MRGNSHVRCEAGEKPEVVTPEVYLSLLGEVPEFPSKLSTMRKYNISATIVLQDIAQIEAMYKDNWKTLVGNCSTFIFLGTQEINTLKYFSEMLGKKTIRSKSNSISQGGKGGSSNSFQQTAREVMSPDELGRLSAKECIVFTQNQRPVLDQKYKYERHPRYEETADAHNELGFQYNTMSVYDNTKSGNISSIIKARQEAARYRNTFGDPEKSGGVTDPEYAEKKKLEGDLNTNVSEFEADEKVEAMAYQDYVNDCLEKASECHDPVCVLKVDHMPLNKLPKLTQQVTAMLGRKNLLIFTDVHSKDNLIAGIAVMEEALIPVLESPYVKGLTKYPQNLVSVVINGNTYEKYVQQIVNYPV